jgi:hypothetical protein
LLNHVPTYIYFLLVDITFFEIKNNVESYAYVLYFYVLERNSTFSVKFRICIT